MGDSGGKAVDPDDHGGTDLWIGVLAVVLFWWLGYSAGLTAGRSHPTPFCEPCVCEHTPAEPPQHHYQPTF